MRLILDCNILLVSLPRNSKYRLIFDLLLAGDYTLFISNEILSEYTEVIESKTNATVANNVAEMLLNLENVHKVDVYYEWRLISQDPDDNKYVDAAVSAGVDFLVSNDQHFNVLAQVDFPKVQVISIEGLMELLQNHQGKK